LALASALISAEFLTVAGSDSSISSLLAAWPLDLESLIFPDPAAYDNFSIDSYIEGLELSAAGYSFSPPSFATSDNLSCC